MPGAGTRDLKVPDRALGIYRCESEKRKSDISLSVSWNLCAAFIAGVMRLACRRDLRKVS